MPVSERTGGRMSKIHLLLGCFLAISMLMTGCESYNTESGKAPGGLPGQATEAAEDRPINCGSDPNVQCMTNDNPKTPQSPQITAVPTVPLSFPKQSGKTDQAADWIIYRDSVYGFEIAYPPQFSIKVWESADLAKMKPGPVAGLRYYDPSKSVGEIASAYFTLRIYDMGSEASVEAWLKANGLYLPQDGWTIKEYKGEHFSGFQVNSSLFKAPGVFYYVPNGKYLYQLTPLGEDAEKMLNTLIFAQNMVTPK
jgi:hypothetical protein